jgi:hypothetical protein
MLYNWDWLSEAQRHVRQNTGSKTAGVDGITMRGFEERLEANLQTLQEALRAGTFEPLPVRRRTIQEVKRNGKIKHRRLGIPMAHAYCISLLRRLGIALATPSSTNSLGQFAQYSGPAVADQVNLYKTSSSMLE